jgi:hypothetical protein
MSYSLTQETPMCVSVATCAKLKEEGISWSEDTINFDKDALLQVA